MSNLQKIIINRQTMGIICYSQPWKVVSYHILHSFLIFDLEIELL